MRNGCFYSQNVRIVYHLPLESISVIYHCDGLHAPPGQPARNKVGISDHHRKYLNILFTEVSVTLDGNC